MPYIEFLGLPGVGKTTLYENLISRRLSLPLVRFGACMSHVEKTVGKKQFADTKAEAFRVCEKEFQEWFDVVVSLFKMSDANSVIVVKRMYWIRKAFERVALLRHYEPQQWVLFDELIMQLGISLSLSSSVKELSLHEYFSVCPKPNLLVVLRTEEKSLRQRIFSRALASDRANRDIDYCKVSRVVDTCVNAMNGSAVRVLEVDCNQSAQAVAKAVRGQIGHIVGQ